MIDELIVKSLKELKQINYEMDYYKANAVTLIFPKKNESKKEYPTKRISEQEAKILFCQNLLENKINFSIETPTIQKYQQTGKIWLSGNIDVCIYEITNNCYFRKNCIEFKAHNVSKNYKSDIEKLFFEKGENYFIHVLPGINNGTLYNSNNDSKRKSVIDKYLDSINKIAKDPKISFTTLTFYICVLDPFIILKNSINKNEIEYAKEKLLLVYSVINNEISINNRNWRKIEI
jgi:hypothetical protein